MLFGDDRVDEVDDDHAVGQESQHGNHTLFADIYLINLQRSVSECIDVIVVYNGGREQEDQLVLHRIRAVRNIEVTIEFPREPPRHHDNERPVAVRARLLHNDVV